MNILYLCADHGIPIRGHKGAAVHVRMMADAFARAGHNVTIMTPRPGPADGPAPQAKIIAVPAPPRPAENGAQPGARQELAYVDHFHAAARDVLAQGDFDFIYERYSLWSDVGARLTHATRLPLVLEVNAPLVEETIRYRNLVNHQLAAQIEEIQYQKAYAIAAVSEQLAAHIRSRSKRLRRIHVLPNGVDPARFHPAVRGGSVHHRYGLNGRIIVGFVGRPRPWHDLDTLLRAVARPHADDSRYHLLLVGQAPDDLPTKLAQHGLDRAATLTGPIPHHDIPQYIAAMDVAVAPHPALTDFYFSPLKLFEYLACGVPTVAADIGQLSRIIEPGETGYLYPPGDAAALAGQIRALVADPAHARQVAWQGAAHVLQNHTWDKNARTVIGWIRPQPTQPKAEPVTWPPPVSLPILDHKLRQRLYRATRPDLAAPLLARRLPAFRRKGPYRLGAVADIKVLKYKPGRRCVLAYTLDGRTRKDRRPIRHILIGKLFRDERGRRLHRLQHYLWQNEFGPQADDDIHVPRSLAYVPEMRMQVQEQAPGATINELVARTGIDMAVRRAAAGLAKLHNMTIATPPHNGDEPFSMRTYLLDDERQSLARFREQLTQIRPGDVARIDNLYAILRNWADRLPPMNAPSPVHRDFYYSQVLIDGRRLTLIDFDLFALGDPAIDVANFVAHLHFLGLDRLNCLGALTQETFLFLDSYTCYRPVDDAFWQRFDFYRAATFFRLMNVVASRPGLSHHFETLFRSTSEHLEMA